MFILPLDEQPGDNFIQAYWHILSDPAHLAVEVTITILLDVLLIGTIWPLVRSYVNMRLRREHAELDAEHGIQHGAGDPPIDDDALGHDPVVADEHSHHG